MRFTFSAILFLLIFWANPAFASEYFDCAGELTTFGFNGRSSQQINSPSHKVFSIRRDRYLSLSVTFDEKNALAKIFPWNGIHFKKLPFAEKSQAKIKFTSDGENWFEVHVTQGDKIKKLSCQFRQY